MFHTVARANYSRQAYKIQHQLPRAILLANLLLDFKLNTFKNWRRVNPGRFMQQLEAIGLGQLKYTCLENSVNCSQLLNNTLRVFVASPETLGIFSNDSGDKIDSSACSFCGVNDESLEHLFVTCLFTATLWEKLVIWCNNINIKVESLSAVDIIFGDWQRKEDFLLLNHIILIAKQYIYYCRINNSKLLFNVLLVRIKSVYLLECQISTWKNKRQAHSLKWGQVSFLKINSCFETCIHNLYYYITIS